MDSYSLIDGIYGGLSCNYPEAYIEASSHFENFTVVTSKDRTNFQTPKLIALSLPGNCTHKNINIYDTYGTLLDAHPLLEASLWPA